MREIQKKGRPIHPYGDGFSEEQKKITTLSYFLEFETWTPLMACLLVSGVVPFTGCTEIPKGAFGLDGCFITEKEDAFHFARWVLELWNSRENAPARVRPADFVAWCKSKEIDTCWLSEIDDCPTPEPQATTNPAPEPPAAPVVADSAHGGVEADKAGPVNKKWVMKKAALINKHTCQWATIKGDFHSASENGLSQAAKAPGHGEWFEADALKWAEQRGKLKKEEEQGPATLATVWTGKKHTLRD